MLIVQHNCRRAYAITIAALESGLRVGAALVCLQEPYVDREFGHGGYVIQWPEKGSRRDCRVAVAVRKDLLNAMSTDIRTDLVDHPYFLAIDVWELAPGPTKRRLRRTRLVNVYDNIVGMGRPWQGNEPRRRRALEDVNWEPILQGRVLLIGDFNAHSTVWNPRSRTRANAAPLESLIDIYELFVNNDPEVPTRPKQTPGLSIIDLAITSPELGPLATWYVDSEHSTPSDHELIVVEWDEMGQPIGNQPREVTGWDIEGLLADLDALEAASKDWKSNGEGRPALTDGCVQSDVAEEAAWIQATLTEVINQHARQLRVTAYSKRWWGPRVKSERRLYGQAKRAWARGAIGRQDLKEARNQFYRTIREEKRGCWESFLQGPERNEIGEPLGQEDSARCWRALRYTSPRASTTTPVIKGPQGQVATTTGEKEELIREVAFPPPPNLGAGRTIPPGTAHKRVTTMAVQKALFSQAVQKAPGPDRLNFRALRLLWRWDQERVVALVRQCLRLGVHPHSWKTARGILLKKPSSAVKRDYSMVKAYRVISLLNCLGKVVEKVAADAISSYCEAAGVLHRGQMGSRRRRSAIDAVACLIQEVHGAWAEKQLAGALLMDVKGAFDHVAAPKLTDRMLELGIDGDLVRWTRSFLADRKVQLVVDGFQCPEKPISTGVPQGSPASPILFIIYISRVFHVIEEAVPGMGPLSFADDIGLVAAAGSVDQVCEKLQKAGEVAIQWGHENAVQFDAEKTEAMLFTRKRGRELREQTERARITVEGHEVSFHKEATRWLGIWLDTGLTLKDHYQTCLRKARSAEARLRTISQRHGLAPGLVRRIQIAAIQAVAFYGSELWWRGQKNREVELQRLVNGQARAITGAFRTTPIGPLLREAGLEPAETALDNRQRRYTARLLTLPEGHPGTKILPVSFRDGDRQAQPGEQPPGDREWAESGKPRTLGQHLARSLAVHLRTDPSGGFERTVEAHPSTFPGRVMVPGHDEAIEQAQKEQPGLVLWSDGSRLEDGRVGAGVAWTATPGHWRTVEIPLGRSKEVFDAELQGVCRALELAQAMGENRQVTVFVDSQAAISRLQHTEPGPGQALALRAHRAAKRLRERRVGVTVQWVPGHMGVEGNERADQAAKQAATRPARDDEISLAHAHRVSTEARRGDGQKWLAGAMARRSLRAQRTYRPAKGLQPDPAATAAPKAIASRYYQLKTGHAATGTYLQRIKAQEDSACRWCQAPNETVSHGMFECRQWQTQRRKLKGNLIRARVQYPSADEDHPEGRLFGDWKATKAILAFIASTEVGMRHGEWLQAAERARKDNELGLETLDDEERQGEG